MRTRNDIEQLELDYLAPYAMKSRDSKGREFPEPDHSYRTCYQRDRDRIVHSAAFRKLEEKTQVFVIFEGDYYRTRLTHTIEVAQIGRSIGRSLRLNEDLIEAIALAHDLGHPPFGHAGEEVLKELMAKYGGFNHNLRSYDIVTKHEKRYPDFDGLNLTQEVRVGILKHETDYDKAGFAEKYKNEGPTIEAQIVNFADSLAYVNHDVDDGLKSGCISGDDLKESALWRQAMEKVGKEKDQEMLRYQVVKALIDMQVKDFIIHTDACLKELNFNSSDEVKHYKKKVVGFSPEMEDLVKELQELLMDKLYHHYRVRRMTNKAKRIITDLFNVYLNDPKQLPPEIYPRTKNFEKRTWNAALNHFMGLNRSAVKEQYHIICHHIAGMTDRSALDEHKRLFNAYTKV